MLAEERRALLELRTGLARAGIWGYRSLVTRAERQRIWAVYESACELSAPDRAAFVEVSLTEEHLRAKALELLASADAPLDSPPLESEEPVEHRWQLLGQSLGRFEILAPVGRGGMGEV